MPRLLELGASFLNGIAPNPDHPARRHALLVEMILRVGLSATTPQASAASPASSAAARPSPGGSGSLGQGHFAQALGERNGAPSALAASFPSDEGHGSASNGPTSEAGARPPASSFDSWLWDTTTPSSGAVSGPLRMQDGSFVMPDLTISSSGTAASGSTVPSSLPPLSASYTSTSRLPMTALEATAAAASAGRRGDAAQAMASLLNEVNPFLDDFCKPGARIQKDSRH